MADYKYEVAESEAELLEATDKFADSDAQRVQRMLVVMAEEALVHAHNELVRGCSSRYASELITAAATAFDVAMKERTR